MAQQMHLRDGGVVLMSVFGNCKQLAAKLGGVAHRSDLQNPDSLKTPVDLAMPPPAGLTSFLPPSPHAEG